MFFIKSNFLSILITQKYKKLLGTKIWVIPNRRIKTSMFLQVNYEVFFFEFFKNITMYK